MIDAQIEQAQNIAYGCQINNLPAINVDNIAATEPPIRACPYSNLLARAAR